MWEFSQHRPSSQSIRRLQLIKEKQHLKLGSAVLFRVLGKCKSLGSRKLFLWYAPQLPEASILGFLILRVLPVHHRGCLQHLLVWWWASCPSWVPSEFAIQAAVRWWHGGCGVLCYGRDRQQCFHWRITSAVQLWEGRRPAYYGTGLSGMTLRRSKGRQSPWSTLPFT